MKAGLPGWGILVPFYNLYLICKIAGKPAWWMILILIPILNIFFGLLLALEIAKAFSKSPSFGFGLWAIGLIFVPILGFDSSRFSGSHTLQEQDI